MSLWGQMGLQEGTSVLGVEIQCLYDYAMLVMAMIFSFVGYMMLKAVVNKFYCSSYLDNQLLETLWTVFPLGLLLVLGLPSIKLLYLMDELELPEATVKVIGHRWYWSYEYSGAFGSDFSFDSYSGTHSSQGPLAVEYRMLEVDNRCVMLHMRALVSSEDVIHSWAIPSACIKVDAIPGRINQVGLCFLYPGVFYGQCSELCGVNHSFMPVCVEAVSVEVFTSWIIGNHNKNANNNNNNEYWLTSSAKSLWGVICKIVWYFVGLGEVVGKLYVWWWKSLFYYGVYVPIKYTFSAGVELMKWVASTCISIGEWVGWFVTSPVDATIYAVFHISSKVYNGFWFAVTKPFEFSLWVVKSVYNGVWKTISFFVEGTGFFYLTQRWIPWLVLQTMDLSNLW